MYSKAYGHQISSKTLKITLNIVAFLQNFVAFSFIISASSPVSGVNAQKMYLFPLLHYAHQYILTKTAQPVVDAVML